VRLKRRRKLVNYLNLLDQPIRFNPFLFSRTFFLWALLGLMGGLIAGIYWIVLEIVIGFLGQFEGWLVVPTMAISGFLAGLIIHFIGDPGEISLIVNNIRFNKGKLDPKRNPSMILSSLLCVGSGGSLGPEAPLVQVTGSTGTWLGKIFRLKGEELRSMSIAGMAAGFTALFGAPLGGSLFALEILHHKHIVQYYQAIIPALVSSLFSYMVFALIISLGLGALWQVPVYEYHGMFDFGLAVLYGAIAAAIGWFFIYFTKSFKKLFEWKPLPIYIKMLIGGIFLGLISYAFPITRYFSHYEVNELLTTPYTLTMLFAILFFKIAAISITVTSGWRGGFIIPLFFVGATLGLIISELFPDINASLAIICCMAAINSTVTRTPMSTTILVATLTGFTYLIPILFASLTGYFLAPKLPFIKAQLSEEKEE